MHPAASERRPWVAVGRWVFAHPVWAALAVGAVLRGAAAAISYGWFAPDDLNLAISQGDLWLHAPDAPLAESIRSPLLSVAFYSLMRQALRLGCQGPAAVMHFAYGALGLYSLAAIPGTYVLARCRFDAATAAVAAWLTAAYALMPHISTRALIEVLAIVPLVWGLAAVAASDRAATAARFAQGLAAALLLGMATLIRFQLGLAWAVGGSLLLHRTIRSGRSATVGGFVVGSAVAAMAQAALDMRLGRPMFATWYGYLHFNVHHSHTLGTSSWATYLGEFMLLLLPPAGWFLLPAWLQAARRHATVAWVLGIFVAVHSGIGHKEDRFMFSVLPLFFIPLAAALMQAYRAGVWPRRAVRVFAGTNAIALLVATGSDAHRNVTAPLIHVGQAPGAPSLYAVGFTEPALPRYYMGPKTQLQHVADLAALQGRLQGGAPCPDFILLRQLPDAATAAALEALPGCACAPSEPYSGDWVDRLLVRVNHHNRRRAPTALVACRAAAAPDACRGARLTAAEAIVTSDRAANPPRKF